MERLKLKDLHGHQELSTEEMEKVKGGIDTVPLPEKIAYLFTSYTRSTGTVMIGTWPTPERTYLVTKYF